ncbi:MAG TPA: hypothetical protein G4O12_05245 [Dehalococcoidia bacterium]|nr:hypothetical protein [Dehalococcoidia bacterium]
MEKTRKPTVAGILDIISAVFVLVQVLGPLLQWHSLEARILLPIIVIIGILAIVGGIYALRRKIWGLALAGAICATLSQFTFFLGIAAIILTVVSKKEFK